jgi:hypothetical protein
VRVRDRDGEFANLCRPLAIPCCRLQVLLHDYARTPRALDQKLGTTFAV